eukprot:403333482
MGRQRTLRAMRFRGSHICQATLIEQLLGSHYLNLLIHFLADLLPPFLAPPFLAPAAFLLGVFDLGAPPLDWAAAGAFLMFFDFLAFPPLFLAPALFDFFETCPFAIENKIRYLLEQVVGFWIWFTFLNQLQTRTDVSHPSMPPTKQQEIYLPSHWQVPESSIRNRTSPSLNSPLVVRSQSMREQCETCGGWREPYPYFHKFNNYIFALTHCVYVLFNLRSLFAQKSHIFSEDLRYVWE